MMQCLRTLYKHWLLFNHMTSFGIIFKFMLMVYGHIEKDTMVSFPRMHTEALLLLQEHFRKTKEYFSKHNTVVIPYCQKTLVCPVSNFLVAPSWFINTKQKQKRMQTNTVTHSKKRGTCSSPFLAISFLRSLCFSSTSSFFLSASDNLPSSRSLGENKVRLALITASAKS